MELQDREFWSRYARDHRGMTLMGVIQEEYQSFRLVSGSGHRIVRSMLSINELALLYALSRHYYRGEGEIVDLGPLLGASSFALARGLYDSTALSEGAKSARIHSYDLFRSKGYEQFLSADFEPTPSGSLLHEFNRINRDLLDYIVPSQGDLLSWSWDGRPVEILFIDVAKTWELNQHVLETFFPCLIPGKSIVVQQDYIHFNEYWIHIVMEMFRDRFELLGMMRGATAFYKCIKGFSKQDFLPPLKAMDYRAKSSLLEAARARAPEPVQEVMKAAAAKCAIEHGQLDEAASLLDGITTEPLTKDPVLEVSGIAKSNLAAVRNMLAAARAKRQ